jgi:DNA-3-methyladenine glycosylase
MKTSSKLPPEFYLQRTEIVARKLLGQRLVHIYKGKRLSGIITETEAYLGLKDKAAHSYHGKKTPRTQTMYLEGGHAYIYLIYGLYYCFNVVTGNNQRPEAVLIRAVRPEDGIQTMHRFRKTKDIHKLTTGPAKLCQALHIERAQNAQSLQSSTLFIEPAITISSRQIMARPRVGIDYAEEAVHWPLRFYIKDETFISKK